MGTLANMNRRTLHLLILGVASTLAKRFEVEINPPQQEELREEQSGSKTVPTDLVNSGDATVKGLRQFRSGGPKGFRQLKPMTHRLTKNLPLEQSGSKTVPTDLVNSGDATVKGFRQLRRLRKSQSISMGR